MRERIKVSLSRRNFLRTGIFAAAGTVAAGIVDTGTEPGQLAIARVSVPLPTLPPGFDGYRIVHLTDLHFGPAIARATITRALWLTDDLAPDLIVITGDLITYYLEEKALRTTLAQLDAPDGVWAVLGNHDHWFDPGGVRRVLAETGVAELRNANTAITRSIVQDRRHVAVHQCRRRPRPSTACFCLARGDGDHAGAARLVSSTLRNVSLTVSAVRASWPRLWRAAPAPSRTPSPSASLAVGLRAATWRQHTTPCRCLPRCPRT